MNETRIWFNLLLLMDYSLLMFIDVCWLNPTKSYSEGFPIYHVLGSTYRISHPFAGMIPPFSCEPISHYDTLTRSSEQSGRLPGVSKFHLQKEWWSGPPCLLLNPSVFIIWLVVSTPLKNMKVSWDDEIPNWMKNEKSYSKPPTRSCLLSKSTPSNLHQPWPVSAKRRPVAPEAGSQHDPQLPGPSAGSSGWVPRPPPAEVPTKAGTTLAPQS